MLHAISDLRDQCYRNGPPRRPPLHPMPFLSKANRPLGSQVWQRHKDKGWRAAKRNWVRRSRRNKKQETRNPTEAGEKRAGEGLEAWRAEWPLEGRVAPGEDCRGPWRGLPRPLERTAEAPGDWADLERAEQAALLHLKSQATKKFLKLIQQTDDTNKHKTKPKQLKKCQL